MSPVRPWLAVALAAASLGACGVDATSSYRPTEAQQRHQDRFGPRYVATVAPVYCYTTLGRPECYAAPVAGWERRLISYYGSQPD
jgi:hypothetical protein